MKLQLLSVRNDLDKIRTEVKDVWKVQVSTLTSRLETTERSNASLQREVADFRQKLADAKKEAAVEANAKRAEIQSQLQASQQEAILKLKNQLSEAQQEVVNWQKKEAEWHAATSSLKNQLQESKVVTDQTASVQREVAELQQLLQSKDVTCAKFKTAVEVEWQKVADLELKLQQNLDLVDGFKYSADRAEKTQVALRLELAEVKKELRLLKLAR
ncbi:hypothetical protein R1sor_010617 [Riccia sorocarpa]|uniref:Uncharacterized protein n=1 Tax=Riccia sorocarpa TaxID=122646 RepID=A0ABD3HZZ3_9MARC